MKRLLILGVVLVAAAVGVAIAVAATTGGESTATTGGATVSVKKLPNVGRVLVDAKGRALYRSDQEKRGMVLCKGACLSFWTPLTVTGTPKVKGVPGKFATIKRSDGRRQVTYGGRPLYSFKLDKAGKATGDGFKDAFGSQKFTWRVAHPVGVASTPTTTPTPSTTPSPYPGY